jgi:mono/diheme cytochrome c family protein
MRYFVLYFLTILFAISCSDRTVKTTEEKVPENINNQKQNTAAQGLDIYTNNCVVCHGDKGDKGLMGAPNLSISMMTLEERIDIIQNGKNTMPAFGSKLSSDEIKAVALYTQTFP